MISPSSISAIQIVDRGLLRDVAAQEEQVVLRQRPRELQYRRLVGRRHVAQRHVAAADGARLGILADAFRGHIERSESQASSCGQRR